MMIPRFLRVPATTCILLAMVMLAGAASSPAGEQSRTVLALGQAPGAPEPVVLHMIAGSSPSLSVLVGTTIQCEGSGTEGHPSVLEWRITEPGGAPPVNPMATGPSMTFLVDDIGSWHIELLARYDHEAPAGTPYTSAAMADVLAKSVVADLQVSSDIFDTDDEIFIDGSASTWAIGVSPGISWSQTSGPTPFDCGSNLTCTIPAGTLDPGDYSFSLTLSDSVSGDVDMAAVAFTVEEVPDLSVDFTWTPANPDPGAFVSFPISVTPPATSVFCVNWTWGDGSIDPACPCYGLICTNGSHVYQVEGWYNVKLEIVTGGGETVSQTHLIQVGDPPDPPSAAMSFAPTAPTVMQGIDFSMTGTCEAPCSAIWTFGDGTQSTEMAPTHAFDHHGSYSVQLALTNDGGTDTTSQVVAVGNCWSPPAPTQQGTCYGGDVTLLASGGTSYLWSTGDTAFSTTIGIDGVYWVSEADASGTCWGTSEMTVVLTNCGDPGGDANLDGIVDTADTAALVIELSDSDGTAVVTSGGGDRTAPGGDVTGDGQLTADDVQAIIDQLFTTP